MTSAYTEEKLDLRQQVLLILFKNFGTGDYSNQSIYECADDWCSKQVTTAGACQLLQSILYWASHDNT